MSRTLWRLVVVLAASGSWSAAHAQNEAPSSAATEQPPSQTPVLAPTIVEAEAPVPASRQEGRRLPARQNPFEAGATTGYRADTSTTATGDNVPLFSTPATVTVIPKDLIRDTQALRLEDLLRNVPGAVKTQTPLANNDEFSMRGFPLRYGSFRRDGFVDPIAGTRDVANIERIEFLQGPASILYGAMQPAGVVNYITERPNPADASSSFGYQFGSFGLQRITTDTQSILAGGSGASRLNVALEDGGSFRDFGFQQRILVAPTLTWRLDTESTLTTALEYYHNDSLRDAGVAAFNGNVFAAPSNRFLGEPGDHATEWQYRAVAFLDRQLSDDAALQIKGSLLWFPGDLRGTFPLGFAGPGSSTLLRLRQTVTADSEQYHSVIANLTRRVETPRAVHQFLVGNETGWLLVPDFDLRFSNPFFNPFPIDLFSPVYGAPVDTPFFQQLEQNQFRNGVYFQDLVERGRWKLLAGVRYDVITNELNQSTNLPANFPVGGVVPLPVPRSDSFVADYGYWSPRVGVVYEPRDGLMSYASFSHSFDSIFGRQADGSPLAPETSTSWEGGFKLALLEGALQFTSAGFYIDKRNGALRDPANDLFFVQLGAQRSQGVELSTVGNLTDAWSLVANAAYIDTEITQDSQAALVGRRFPGIPLQTANLWTRYNWLQDESRTVGTALGVTYVGARDSDIASTLELPGYTRWDAGVYLTRRRLSLSLYFENLFDVDYFTGANSQFSIFPGAPSNFRGALVATF